MNFVNLTSVYEANSIFINGVLLLILSLITLQLLKYAFSLLLSRLSIITETGIDNIVAKEVKNIPFSLLIFTSVYLVLMYWEFNRYEPNIFRIVTGIFYILWTFEIIRLINKTIRAVIKELVNKTTDRVIVTGYNYISIIIRSLLWILGTLFIFANLGYDVSAFITGLGIGGIAIALALQNILKDLFGSFLIIFDKPIRINDYVIIGDVSGVVKEIGIRSTKITADDGNEVVIPNNDIIVRIIKKQRGSTFRQVVLNINFEAESMPTIDMITSIVRFAIKNYSIKGNTLKIIPFEINKSEIKYKIIFVIKFSEEEEYSMQMQYILTNVAKLINEQYKLNSITLDTSSIK
jgi:small-conductance mechanosensitive channel